ncbi:MAG: TetR/AcrR family transcriptional regulator [Acidimicrobiales bacterium]
MAAGRLLDTTRDEDIRRAALELLLADGYDRLTIESVAARAHAGKATIYRRWASKADLVIDALNRTKPLVEPPETGSLSGDLHALVPVAAPGDAGPMSLMYGLATSLASALARDPELARAFREHFCQPRQELIARLLGRARARGEVPPGRGSGLFLALIPALLLYRVVFDGEIPDAAYMAEVIDTILVPLATAPVVLQSAERNA